MLLFRVGTVPVLLAPSWWIGSLLVVVLYTPLVSRLLPGADIALSAVLAGAFAVLLGMSVLAHELGHCVVALRLGVPVRRVRLFLLGGLSEVARSPRRPGQDALIAVAGPLVSLVLALVCWLLLLAVPEDGAVWLLVAQCAVANAAVGVFNLLPGLPLDGGRLLRAGIWAVHGGRSTGTRVAVAGGALVAVGVLGWALWGMAQGSDDRWLRLGVGLVTAWFVAMGATSEFSSDTRRPWPEGLSLSDLMRPVLQLPAESPVSAALAASAGRGVVLVRADGIAAGLLDAEAAERLALNAPHSPAELAAQPISAETVLLTSDSPDEIAEHVDEVPTWQFLVVDGEGNPKGVLRRDDVHSALAAPGRLRGDSTGPFRTG
ncbi:site-2 protease family protein [Saccharomonospora xinjiangensis]|uniref:Zinc metalloprotease n=1 Tax=Saccharomonospora xinjiangensis XJ-54 TaxID=882086 RepID=I0V7V0_9PSEU|nr:site-2 protease family protein [Saccharomonospora xinjiangensis]EID56203.1 Zn-dependent protease [Saccharomonospora xinjiangensis XJ-54]